MTYKYSWVGVLFFLLIGVVSGYSGAYIDINKINLGPTLNILNGHNRGVDISLDVSCQEELVFELTLTNSKDYWVHWDNLTCNLQIIHRGDEQNYDLTQTLSGKNCLPPKEEINVWIPFETYNELKEEEERLGHWTIKPDVSLEGVSCFSSVDITKDICSGLHGKRTSSFLGNEKEINVVKEEPTIHHTLDNLWRWITTGEYVILKLGGVAGAIITIWALLGKFGKGKGKGKKR